MKICFPSITFIEHPVIWNYDPENNKAVCTMELAGCNEAYNKSALLKSLQEIKGITVSHEEEVVITDMKTFLASHPMMEIHEIDTAKKLRRTHSRSKGTFFGSKTRKDSITTPPEILEKASSSATENQPKGIRVEAFISRETSPGVWGNTLSCLDYFGGKNKADSSSRQVDLIHSQADMVKALQYLKNESIYPIKKGQMEIICMLFNKILAPLYDEINDQPLSTKFSNYLRDLVEKIMLNQRLNYGPTYYEKLSQEERDKLFPDPNEFEFAVQQGRIARVNIMLRDLLFFVTPDMQAQKLTSDSFSVKQMELLRQRLSIKDKAVFIEKLNLLRELTVEVGHLEYEFDLRMVEMRRQMDAKAACIGPLHSFYCLIQKTFKSILDEKDKVVDELTEKTVDATIVALRETYSNDTDAKSHIGQPLTCDEDFYLSKAWDESLSTYLSTNIPPKIKKKDLVITTKNCVMEFVKEHLKRHLASHTPSDQDVQTTSNFGLI
ncbi:hypothetical protein [Legionella cardiaca]|uniref:Uncharacterized protein n=1 Tax=Legionella cardiaca TaxID=1071983 RepID=A0ABY8AUM8_9GAMM|nr:hypothetical protein [Legionella cardiaca]WED44390.1 hypothetical protein PXX05_06280 [Legionella cardiaca]